MSKKKVSRFSFMALLLAAISAIAILLSGTIASAYLVTDSGGTSDCTSVQKQGPSTTKQVCGNPICTTTTVQVPQQSTQQVLVSAGYYYGCPKSTYVPGYYDYHYSPCYTVTTQSCSTSWSCLSWWGCWPSTKCSPSTSTVCPAPYSVWVPGYTHTYTGSCWSPPVYATQQVTKWVSQQQQSCVPNCQTVTVPGDITYELKCTPVATVTPAPTPKPCYRDCACDLLGDCCSGYTSASDQACKPKVCAAGQEVSRSCSGCKLASLTMCNSYGTGTYSLPSQYAQECTSGCAATATPPPKVCAAGQEVSRSCSGTCKTATAKICNSLGTANYDSTVTDNSCTSGCAAKTPTPVPKPTPKSLTCAQKPKECGSGFDAFNGAYDTVITWNYNIFADDCFKSEQQCGAGEKCNAATGSCEKAAAQAQTCNTVCSGDTAINWHLVNGNYCAIDSNVDCAAQGKTCQEKVGCVAKPKPAAAKDCTSLGCPLGYYCTALV